MRYEHFIELEQEKLYLKEIANITDVERRKYVIEFINNFDGDRSDFLVENSNLFPELYESIFILKIIHKKIGLKKIKNLGFDKSKSVLKTAIYVSLEIEKFKTEEYFDSKLLNFYKKIFNDYPNLIEIDDFLQYSGILDINLSLDVWRKKEFIDFVISAIDKYPANYVLRLRLIGTYTRTDQFQKAISLINETVKLMDDNNIFNKPEDDMFDRQLSKLYLDIIQARAYINFSLKNYNAAMQDVDFILSNLPDHALADLEEDETLRPPKELDYYIETILIRISINLKNDNKTELLADFNAITDEWVIVDLPSWKEYYPEAVEYIVNRETVSTKTTIIN